MRELGSMVKQSKDIITDIGKADAEEEVSPLIMPEEAFEGDYIIATYFYSSRSLRRRYIRESQIICNRPDNRDMGACSGHYNTNEKAAWR